jgi:hypothetical protein
VPPQNVYTSVIFVVRVYYSIRDDNVSHMRVPFISCVNSTLRLTVLNYGSRSSASVRIDTVKLLVCVLFEYGDQKAVKMRRHCALISCSYIPIIVRL